MLKSKPGIVIMVGHGKREHLICDAESEYVSN